MTTCVLCDEELTVSVSILQPIHRECAMETVLVETSDWVISFDRLARYDPPDFDALMMSTSDWVVSLDARRLVWTPTTMLSDALSANSNWAVALDRAIYTADLSYHDRIAADGAVWALQTRWLETHAHGGDE